MIVLHVQCAPPVSLPAIVAAAAAGTALALVGLTVAGIAGWHVWRWAGWWSEGG